MSKDEFKNDPAEEDIGGSSGLGKEAKIGFTVIALLVIGLGVALTYRLMRSAPEEKPETTAVAKKTDLKLPDQQKKHKPAKDDTAKLFGGTKTKIVPAAAASNSAKKPDNAGLQDWKNTARDVEHKHRRGGEASPGAPPSFGHERPNLAGVDRNDRYSSRHDRYSSSDTSGYSSVEAALPPPPVPEDSRFDNPSPSKNYSNQYSSNTLKDGSTPAMTVGRLDDRGYHRDPPSYGNYDDRFRRPPPRPHYRDSAARRDDGKYEVQPNDSFWTISEKLYGTGAYFKALAKHNAGKDGEDDSLQPGSMIEAPEIAELEKSFPDLCPKASRREAMQSQQLGRTSTVSTRHQYRGGRTYTVVEGDTLFDIARYELGKASRWADIYDLNRDTLGKDFNYLVPGTQLVMPNGDKDQGETDVIAEPPPRRLRR